jgi:hypothetical protein
LRCRIRPSIFRIMRPIAILGLMGRQLCEQALPSAWLGRRRIAIAGAKTPDAPCNPWITRASNGQSGPCSGLSGSGLPGSRGRCSRSWLARLQSLGDEDPLERFHLDGLKDYCRRERRRWRTEMLSSCYPGCRTRCVGWRRKATGNPARLRLAESVQIHLERPQAGYARSRRREPRHDLPGVRHLFLRRAPFAWEN